MQSRGEVRRMADAFAEGDVETVSSHLQSALRSHHHTLQTLEAFLHENQQLTKLVQDLPHKVSHSIMVPFGKAAFFPGRLVHTNEFLVLLGEGYYAECSASKTLDILARRGNFLGSQIAGVNSQLVDFDVESRFFKETLAEAAAGYVDIREELVEPLSSGSASNSEKGPVKVPESDGASSSSTIKERLSEANERGLRDEDKEHDLLMARLDELEAAEAAANLDTSLEDNDPGSSGDTAEFESPEQDYDQYVTNVKQKIADDAGREVLSANRPDQRALSTDYGQVKETANLYGGSLEGRRSLRSPGDLLKFEEWRRSTSKEVTANQSAEAMRDISTLPPKKQESHQPEDKSRPLTQVVPFSQTETQKSEKSRLLTQAALFSQTKTQRSSEILRMSKAFTGTVLERNGLSPPLEQSQDPNQLKKRPISKFKMRQTDT